jgi:Flp pilus assembly protein TadG
MKIQKRNSRPGSFSVELLFILPVLLALILGMVEFSLILAARQQLTAASREGARVAAVGGNTQEVSAAVQTFLGNGALSGAQVSSVLTDKNNNPLPSGANVTVTVTLPTAQVVPDMLAPFGFTLGQDVMVAQTVMRKE